MARQVRGVSRLISSQHDTLNHQSNIPRSTAAGTLYSYQIGKVETSSNTMPEENTLQARSRVSLSPSCPLSLVPHFAS